MLFGSQCSLAVEHPLSKREVVGSLPAIGLLLIAPLPRMSTYSPSAWGRIGGPNTPAWVSSFIGEKTQWSFGAVGSA